MERIANLLGEKVRPSKKTRRTERGDLIEYFYFEARKEWDEVKYGKLTIGREAFASQNERPFFLKSLTEDARRRGGSWAKTFWGALKVSEGVPSSQFAEEQTSRRSPVNQDV
jgi:hypothetical protein